ncbi:succinate dehydrogenase cytochrome b subunit [Sphaerimonospora mesophila]|uniref:succinate dehydrogenase cytochrome b subunit n=1 Tax=Sphaerimonospora mesophila TaxID=37483 RepID=UPI0009FB3263
MTATVDHAIERGQATAPVPVPAAPAPVPTPRRRSGFPVRFLSSTNGKKAVMAVTGAVLVLFLIGHMLGNLKIFLGADSFNGYAEWLRTAGEPALPGRTMLTITEIVLVVAVVLHMWSAVSLARRAARARPVKYAARRRSQASGYATHVMRYGGIVIALFVVWHLLDMTLGVVNPEGHAATPYDRMVAGFAPSRWWVTAFYVIALVMVGLHLRHGVWSAFQTLGLARGRSHRPLRALAGVVALVLVVGFLAAPVAVMIGVIK